MTNFLKYKVILWDFDGVLMDSMPIRDKGFELVLKDYPEDQRSELMTYHRRNGGLSRYVKFRYFFEQIRKEPITDEQVLALAFRFSELMRQELTNKDLLINDSLSFVKRSYTRWNMHIVSGSDCEELNYLCNTLGIAHYFQSIHGSPTPKKELVRRLLQQYEPSECILVGDAVNDYDAAVTNGIDFCGYNNEALRALPANYLDSFNSL